MKTEEATRPFGGHPAESVYVLVDVGASRDRPAAWLQKALPTLNWRSHVFLLGHEDPVGTATAEVLTQVVADFVERQKLASVIVHPVLEMTSATGKPWKVWHRVLAVAKPFQEEAFEEQTESRLLITPIIVPGSGVTPSAMAKAATFLRSHFATPSFYLRKLPPGPFDSDLRRYLDPEDEGEGALVRQLKVNHVFESVLDRVDVDKDKILLERCRRHWVVDARSGEIFACFQQWEDGHAAAHLDTDDVPESHGPVHEDKCARCIGRSVPLMQRNLIGNGRESEGRQVCSALARGLSVEGEHSLAADLARCAFELSDRDDDRAGALIHEGLCRLELGQLEAAEDALALASTYAPDKGVVAYHRGRVQFAWRDYIEALERFEEALESGSGQVRREHLCFQMALCHINLEEYPEARGYLDRCLVRGEESAPVAFYRGVCDFGEGDHEKAMAHFHEALRIGPAAEDLGRVLFYIGTCLKEADRFDEAIEVLEKAVEADPEDLPNHNLLGFCYYKTKRHEEAVRCFLRAVEINPRSAIDWANLGSNLRDLGRTEEAVAQYERALSLDPTIGFARENLARLKKVLRRSES